jgi:uncharacterized protein (DUF1697 family)
VPSYLALLRGINVGGKNLVRMTDLRAAFESMGFDDVATYIQTGNVFFDAPRQKRADLADRIEAELQAELHAPLKVVLLTKQQLEGVIDGAPKGFGGPEHKCDVIFLRSPLTAAKAFPLLEKREGVDSAWKGSGVLYFSRLAAKASGSRLSRVVALPEYQDMTIRSWSTVTKLAGVMAER